MRTLRLFPLAVVAAMAAGGCRTASNGIEETASRTLQRDLTLGRVEAAPVQVASPVELARQPVQQRSTRAEGPRRRAPAPRPKPARDAGAIPAVEPVPTPQPADRLTSAASSANDEASAEPDPHALAPGQTVTVIPASSGPSSEPTWTDRGPPDARRGTTIHTGGRGGDCGGRGPGRHPGGVLGPDLRGLQ